MDTHLTEKQEAVLAFIEDYQLSYGKSPTLREMREHFQVNSDNSILKHLKALEEKGYIQKDDTPRGISLLESVRGKLQQTSSAIRLPVFGSVPAGGPVATDEYIESWMAVGEDIARNVRDYFLLRVTGNSMIDAGIFEGDLVVIDRKKTPKSGDIVVALIDQGNTLKRLVVSGGTSYLKAENQEYPDIHPLHSLEVQGVVSTLIRQYS